MPFRELDVGILRDDAAAVYINGTEVYRDAGLPPGAGFNDVSTISAGGTTENTFFPFFVPSNLLVGGENSIAVEVHQSSSTSSDIAFDLSINALLPTPAPLVSAGSTWRYLDDGSDQDTAWRAPEFDDSLWQSGPARLGYGEPEIATTVGFGGEAADKFRTTYFRHTFDLSEASGIQAAQIRLLADDGAAVFVNGTEVARLRLPTGATFHSDASATTGGLDEHRYLPFVINPALLITGLNTVAVEVHQSGGNSSDLSFDLELLASSSPTLAAVTIEVTGGLDTDSDSDGMADEYELANGLIVGIDDSALDPDADGQTNLHEFLAGTDPFDPASSLFVSTTAFDGAAVSITFQSVPGRSYHLESSLDLLRWERLTNTTITATSSESTLLYQTPDGLGAANLRVATP